MAFISSAINPNATAAIVGYDLKRLDSGTPPAGLPYSIAVIAEANIENQLPLSAPFSFTTSDEVGEKMGYGSPAHRISQILRPPAGGGAGGIDTLMIPQAAAGGSTPAEISLTVSGTATKGGTGVLKINGRDQINGQNYTFPIEEGDTADEVGDAIATAISKVLASPVTAANASGVVTLTTKWSGKTSARLNVTVDLGISEGIAVAIGTLTGGVGTPSLDLSAITESIWYPVLVNGLGTDALILDALEAWNGNAKDKTGRYAPTVWRPTTAYTGTTLDSRATLLPLASTRASEMTNFICPAPNAEVFDFEIAANWALIVALKGDSASAARDFIGERLTQIPHPPNGDIGEMNTAANRQVLVSGGVSTVTFTSAEGYKISDSVSTYHPSSEEEVKRIYSRSRYFAIHFNMKFLTIYEYNQVVNGKIITKIALPIEGNVTLSQWKGVVANRILITARDRGLISNPEYSIENLVVSVPAENGNRVDTTYPYEMTGSAVVGSISTSARLSAGEALN